MGKENTGQYGIQHYLKDIKKISFQFSMEENSMELTENSQSNVDHDMKERILLVTMKLGAKLKYKNDEKCIKEGLEKMVILV